MSTQQSIAQFISTGLLDGGREIGIDDEVVLDGTIDSLGVTRLIDYLEKEFGVAIAPHDVTIENFRSATTMAALVESRQTAESG
ncbi:MAG: acyl carrier protein [Actinomycetota bacterium]|nr:acyl carrier protein [Actinomycetota bacterium]